MSEVQRRGSKNWPSGPSCFGILIVILVNLQNNNLFDSSLAQLFAVVYEHSHDAVAQRSFPAERKNLRTKYECENGTAWRSRSPLTLKCQPVIRANLEEVFSQVSKGNPKFGGGVGHSVRISNK